MSDDARRRLEDLLDREIEAARALASVLDAERAALTGSSSADVEERAAEKLRLLRGIETMEDERRSLARPAWPQPLHNAGARSWNSWPDAARRTK
jgi:flagellar biosynthesis/type III secretory pathway chaperone